MLIASYFDQGKHFKCKGIMGFDIEKIGTCLSKNKTVF